MSSRLLQGVGVLAILGLVVGSIAALIVVKERIHVTIAAEEAAARRGPDPIEVLRDSLEASAGERERKLEARLDALEAKLDAQPRSGARDNPVAPASASPVSPANKRSRASASTPRARCTISRASAPRSQAASASTSPRPT